MMMVCVNFDQYDKKIPGFARRRARDESDLENIIVVEVSVFRVHYFGAAAIASAIF